MRSFPRPTLLLAGLGLTSLCFVPQANDVPRAHWVDFDGDGLLDLFVSNPAGDRLFRALPGGGHEDVTVASGFDESQGSRAALWGDFDGDGDPDLLRLAAQWRLLLNQDGQFIDETERVGLAHEGLDVSASWRDVDGDGRLELEVLQRDRVLLYRPLDGGTFERIELPLPSPEASGVGFEVFSGEGSDETPRGARDLGQSAERTEGDRTRRGGGRPGAAPAAQGTDPGGSGGPLNASSGISTTSIQGQLDPMMGGVCAAAVRDTATGLCISASTEPEPGMLHPIGPRLWVAPDVGIGGRSFNFHYPGGAPLGQLRLYGSTLDDPTAFGPHWVVNRISGATTFNANTTVNGTLSVQEDEGDAELKIEADPANTNNGWQPRLSLVQDGGNVVGSLGFVNGNNNLALANEFGESKIMIDHDGDVRIVDTGTGVSGFQFNVIDGGHELLVKAGTGKTFAKLDADSAQGGGRFRLWDDGASTSVDPAGVTLDIGTSSGAGRFQLWDRQDNISGPAVQMRARASSTSGADLRMRNRYGWDTFVVDNLGWVDGPGPDREGGRLRLWEGTQADLEGLPAVVLVAKKGDTGSEFRMRNDADVVSFLVDSEQSEGRGALLQMRNFDDVMNFEVDTDWLNTGGARVHLRNGANEETIVLNGDIGAYAMKNSAGDLRFEVVTNWIGSDGARLHLRDGAGDETIILNGNLGRAQVKSIVITGGSDIAEPFRVSGEAVDPGTLVCIDPEQLGGLVVSTEAYDSKVAGIISGAGGIRPGLTLSQQGTIADGEHPVALTGRVWCKADASFGAIRPGDLLTTSARSGHAMRASDPERSFGAVIGKAMSVLEEGTGLVLVLVNLQ